MSVIVLKRTSIVCEAEMLTYTVQTLPLPQQTRRIYITYNDYDNKA